MTECIVDVADIRFTQEHVYDSFNANSAKAGGVVELIEDILAGKKTPRDLPLIRVASKRGAYWCVDNRRLFVYKHCQLGRIPVEVYGWKDSREFEIKWKNGLATRTQTNGGRCVGVIQRTDTPFPRSPVAEPSLSNISVPMTRDIQRSHDAIIAALRKKREHDWAKEAASVPNDTAASAELSLRGILLAGDDSCRKNLKKKRRLNEPAHLESTSGPEVDGLNKPTLQKGAVVNKTRSKKRRRTALAQKKAENNAGVAKLTIALDQEESGDDAYDVEVTAM